MSLIEPSQTSPSQTSQTSPIGNQTSPSSNPTSPSSNPTSPGSNQTSPSSNQTFTLGEAFDFVATWRPCALCFWIFWLILLLHIVVLIVCYVLRKRKDWRLYERRRNLEELRRHQSDVLLQENLSRAIAEYWTKDAATEWQLAVEVEEEISSEENADTNSSENFNRELESRRKEFIKTMRRNAFKKKLSSEESEWSVTLYDLQSEDQINAEMLLAQLVFVLPKPFIPASTSKAYLKEEVRVALFAMLRKINFEGYDCHVGALVASAVVVWNDGEAVKLAGKPFYPSFPLLSLAEVKSALQTPEDEVEEIRRLRLPSPEVPFKMSYQEVMALERSIDQEVADRHLRLRLRLDKIRKKKKNQWTRKLADQLVKALTTPRVFDALAIMNEGKNKNRDEVIVQPSPNSLAQVDPTNTVQT